MENKIIIANWKMNPKTAAEAEALLAATVQTYQKMSNLELIICPPFVYLPRFSEILFSTPRSLFSALGAQNCHWEESGAFTGEISLPMLRQYGVTHVIVGHSERRWVMGESDAVVRKKLTAITAAGLTAVLAVGERVRGSGFDEVIGQLSSALFETSVTEKNLIIAYEPVWAVSTQSGSEPATPTHALQAAAAIREWLRENKKLSDVRLLYGGSVDANTISAFVNKDEIDGVLVGGASVRSEEMVKILEAVGS